MLKLQHEHKVKHFYNLYKGILNLQRLQPSSTVIVEGAGSCLEDVLRSGCNPLTARVCRHMDTSSGGGGTSQSSLGFLDPNPLIQFC